MGFAVLSWPDRITADEMPLRAREWMLVGYCVYISGDHSWEVIEPGAEIPFKAVLATKRNSDGAIYVPIRNGAAYRLKFFMGEDS